MKASIVHFLTTTIAINNNSVHSSGTSFQRCQHLTQFDCSHSILLMKESSCGFRSPDYHFPDFGSLFLVMPQPSLLAFPPQLEVCSHSSTGGKIHTTLSLCRAELSLLHWLPLTLTLGNIMLDLCSF